MGSKRTGLARIEALLAMAAERSGGLGLSSTSRLVAGEIHQSKHTFGAPPLVIQADGTVADTGDNAVNIHHYASGLQLVVQSITAQALVAPVASTSGLDYSGDATDDAGFGIVMRDDTYRGTLNKDYFTVGTSPAFYFSLKMTIGDVSDTDDCFVGFRKVENHQDALDSYDEMAGFNIISGDIKTETIINNATTVTTDITSGGGDGAGNWADGGTHTLKVLVSGDGVVTYQIDGEAASAAAAFTFDDGENVTPTLQFLNTDTTTTLGLILIEWESGLQTDA